LNKINDINIVINVGGYTILTYAVINRASEIVKYLIEDTKLNTKLDINKADRTNKTALDNCLENFRNLFNNTSYYSYINQDISILKYILQKGPNITESNKKSLMNIIIFLKEDKKVQIYMKFRSREMQHKDVGFVKINLVLEKCKEASVVELHPKFEGSKLICRLAPQKTKVIDCPHCFATSASTSSPCLAPIFPEYKATTASEEMSNCLRKSTCEVF
jgi:hypothetical protein